MDFHSLEMVGPLYIEQIKKRGIWTYEDQGRLLYETNTDQYWLGGITDWLLFNLTNDVVKLNHIHFGYDTTSLSSLDIAASNIPCEFNGLNTDVQDSITRLKARNINETVEITNGSIVGKSLDIDANDLFFITEEPRESYNDKLFNLVSSGDLFINLDSTSFGNISIHQALISNETTINNLHSDMIPTNNSSFIQLELNPLFESDPDPGAIHELHDFDGWVCDSTSVTEFHLSTTGVGTLWKCMDSTSLLFNVESPSIIPETHANFQQFLDSCGADFTPCKPYIITDILIVDDIEDYTLLYEHYFRNHPKGDPPLMYDFMNLKVLQFFDGEWIDADPECNVLEELEYNRIYIVPVTNTMFYISCEGDLLKLFDRKRLI